MFLSLVEPSFQLQLKMHTRASTDSAGRRAGLHLQGTTTRAAAWAPLVCARLPSCGCRGYFPGKTAHSEKPSLFTATKQIEIERTMEFECCHPGLSLLQSISGALPRPQLQARSDFSSKQEELLTSQDHGKIRDLKHPKD